MPIGNRVPFKSEVFIAFFSGYSLDFATAIILSGIPCLLALVYYIFPTKKTHNALRIIVQILLLVYILIALGDAGIYREWNAKINLQALYHFKNPAEVFRTISWHLVLLGIVSIILISLPFSWLYRKKLHPTLLNKQLQVSTLIRRVQLASIFLLIYAGLSVIIIRGGLQSIPQNQSAAYFSQSAMANDIAVNSLYNILQDATIANNIPAENLYKLRSNEEAKQLIADDFYQSNEKAPEWLNTKQPNLVYIFLESWSSDNVGCLGGISGCTPQFDKLSKEGILFENAYAMAYVSDQGIPAVLSSYPSASRLAIINQPSKVAGMNCISEELLPLNYATSFMFGGDLAYGNLRGYLLEKKFNHLAEEKNFPELPKGKLGIHDEYMFPKLLSNLNELKQPFLQGFFTVSTHMPYDYNYQDSWRSIANDPEKEFSEATHYSDIQLGKFFDAAKKEAWYKNTLFIIVADHSHNSIKQWNAESPMRQKIPMLFVGGALNDSWRGVRWKKIVSQLDINKTILDQLNCKADHYPFSRNMFDPQTKSSAFYVYFGGCGYVDSLGAVSSTLLNQANPITELKDSLLIKHHKNKATSFQQLIFEDVKLRK